MENMKIKGGGIADWVARPPTVLKVREFNQGIYQCLIRVLAVYLDYRLYIVFIWVRGFEITSIQFSVLRPAP
jgi:hypothetical protein